MIFFTHLNGVSPIKLFKKEHPDHIVGEGHGREGEGKIGGIEYVMSVAGGATDKEGNLFSAVLLPFGEQIGELGGGKLFAGGIECHDYIGWVCYSKQQTPFFLALLLIVHALFQLYFEDGDGEVGVMLKSFAILLDTLFNEGVFGFP